MTYVTEGVESIDTHNRLSISLLIVLVPGSTINLTCTIKYSPEPPAYIFWYHHDEVITPFDIDVVVAKC